MATPYPLTLVVHPSLTSRGEMPGMLQALVDKGHTVMRMDEMPPDIPLHQVDLILGLNAHYFPSTMADLNVLEPALKRARNRRYKPLKGE